MPVRVHVGWEGKRKKQREPSICGTRRQTQICANSKLERVCLLLPPSHSQSLDNRLSNTKSVKSSQRAYLELFVVGTTPCLR